MDEHEGYFMLNRPLLNPTPFDLGAIIVVYISKRTLIQNKTTSHIYNVKTQSVIEIRTTCVVMSDDSSVSSSQDLVLAHDEDMNEQEPETELGRVQNVQEIKNQLIAECNKRPYLDGTFFIPDLEKSSIDGTVVGICQICKKDHNKNHSIRGSLKALSNYISHIKTVHGNKKKDYDKYVTEKKNQKITEEKDNTKTMCKFSQAVFEANIINWILETLVPFNAVESPSFRKIFDDMHIKNRGMPLRHLSARTVARKIEDTFKHNMLSLKNMIKSAQYVCITADTWSSKSRRFIGMTVHWVSELEVPQCEIDEDDCIEAEDFESRPDNCPVETLAHHIRCASHILNLVATTDVMKIIAATESLQSNYTTLLDQSLKRPVATRWNSLYDSLMQIFGLQEKILSNMEALNPDKTLDRDDFRFMEEFLHCHRPIAQALDILQGDKVASYGFLLPTLISTKNRLIECQKLNFQYCDDLVNGLITALETRFKNMFEVVEEGRNAAIAAATHPQFKLEWLKSLPDHAKINVLEALKEAITSIVNNDNQRHQEQANDQVDNSFFLFTPHPDHTTNDETVLGTWDQ
ncbi:Protein of unknown function [Cotesia congregata]|uniref:Uncharacterized protein n=1 Tax=Cotesia congregata TaxID=51543 RepID=A0A8J2HCT9_COTCN|nr:Protein of unknown function [Cotesia congregata]